MTWVLLFVVLPFVVGFAGASLITWGHVAGVRTHRWHIRQHAARMLVDPPKPSSARTSYDILAGRGRNDCRQNYCHDDATTPCGKCWGHCPRCVRTAAAQPEVRIAALEREIKALEAES